MTVMKSFLDKLCPIENNRLYLCVILMTFFDENFRLYIIFHVNEYSYACTGYL
jgi:hypothetical protein